MTFRLQTAFVPGTFKIHDVCSKQLTRVNVVHFNITHYCTIYLKNTNPVKKIVQKRSEYFLQQAEKGKHL